MAFLEVAKFGSDKPCPDKSLLELRETDTWIDGFFAINP
jgi:hypothetical protein